MNQLILLSPEIFLSCLALLLLLGEAFFPTWRKLWVYAGIFGLVACLVQLVFFFILKSFPGASMYGVEPFAVGSQWVQYHPVFNMEAIDPVSIFFKIAIVVTVVLILWLSEDYFEFDDAPMGTYVSLFLFSAVGMMLLVGATDFLMAVISLELLSVTSFILTGFVFHRRTSSEGAIKFFLVGTLSTAILLFGISYYYGYFGTTNIDALSLFPQLGLQPDAILLLIIVFILAGLGFKLAMVPFHMWAPDAYEGAPTPVTAFLSVGPKVAALGFLMRILSNHMGLRITPLLALLAALTMTVGNIGAIHQTDVKRMFAYSSIAQVGYMLVAFVAGGRLGWQAVMVYVFVYIFMNLGVFAGLLMLSNKSHSEEIGTFAGLSRKSMGVSLAMVVFLLSLTGIPPMAGFVGKFAIFAAALRQPGLVWLAVVAVINSVISLYYYFRIIHQIFFRDPSEAPSPLGASPALATCLIVALGVTLAAGVLPEQLLAWVRNVVGS